MSKGSGTLEMQRRYARMYVCMQRSRDRVHACAARMRRCYVSAFRRALMRTFVPDTLSLCASSATRRLELEAALCLPLPIVSAGGEGGGLWPTSFLAF